jgi:hypothetical protein
MNKGFEQFAAGLSVFVFVSAIFTHALYGASSDRDGTLSIPTAASVAENSGTVAQQRDGVLAGFLLHGRTATDDRGAYTLGQVMERDRTDP